ncbi:hypothetical protein [Micromonospora matsumotoense]|uniref:hypothetical protein n=1 Tax=Micromonospora matsumotoense TaxID=121616 RepID=UPI00114CDB1E|nr:hypothetical protein [Micromonospora matsumotoense]
MRDAGQHLHTAVVRDVLGADVNWWRLGDLLGLHPQAAYEQYGQHREGLRTPAEQHPELAVLVTAGLAAEHTWGDEYGIDIEDLGAEHSLFADPTVAAASQAAQLLGNDVWIAVRLPGAYEGEGEGDDDQAIKQWTTVVLGPDELTWLAEALQLNAVDEADDDQYPLLPWTGRCGSGHRPVSGPTRSSMPSGQVQLTMRAVTAVQFQTTVLLAVLLSLAGSRVAVTV